MLQTSLRRRRELYSVVSASGHERLFEDCLRVLCDDLRIVTVVGTDVESENDDEAGVDQYRLAHDFLVEPVNKFLSRMQSRSWSGRAKSRLAESSSVWSRRRTNAHLPGFFEYLSLLPIVVFTAQDETQSQYMRAATRVHAGRISAALVFLLAFLVMSVIAWDQLEPGSEVTQDRALATNVTSLSR